MTIQNPANGQTVTLDLAGLTADAISAIRESFIATGHRVVSAR